MVWMQDGTESKMQAQTDLPDDERRSRSAVEAMRAGAAGYLLKKSAASELFHAIQAAFRGKFYVTPQIARGMQEAFVRNPEAKRRRTTVTPRQREVLQLLAEGKSMKKRLMS